MYTERVKERKGTSSLTAIDPYWLAGLLEATGIVDLARSQKLAATGATFSVDNSNIAQLQAVFTSTGIATSLGAQEKPKLHMQADEAMRLLSMLPPEYNTLLNPTAQQSVHSPYPSLVAHDAFLAGLVDGKQGSMTVVSTTRNGPHPEIYFASRDMQLLQAIEERYIRRSKSEETRSKIHTEGQTGRLTYAHRRAQMIYEDIAPHLVFKRAKAIEVFTPPKKEPSAEEVEQERFAQEHAAYLAGFFELAGLISFKPVTHRNGDIGLSPFIRITGNIRKIEALGRFFNTFSPFFREEQTILRGQPFKNHSLTIAGLKTLPIIKAIAPYLGNRYEVLQLVREWDTLTPQQRTQRWQELRTNPPESNPPRYDELAKNPRYVAGIIDAHKTFGFREKTSGDRRITFLYPVANVTSTNRALLEALHTRYGGHDIVQLAGKKSHTWKIEAADLRRLYNFVKGDLIIQQERANEILGWADTSQIETHLLTTMLNSPCPLSEYDLRSHVLQRVLDTEGDVHYLSHAEVEDHLQRLLIARRITQLGEKDQPVYTATLDAQNIAAIEKSPRATLQLLIHALRPNSTLIISQTGRIVGVGTDEDMTWYIPHAQAKDIKDKLAQRRNGLRRQRVQPDEPFVQLQAGGMIVDKVSTITTISDVKKLEALQEALQLTIEQTMVRDWEDNMDGKHFPLDPAVAAKQIVTTLRSGKHISVESLLPKV